MKITYILLISLLLGLSQNIAIAADFSLSHNEPQSVSSKREVKKVTTKAHKHKQKLRNKKQVKRYTDSVQQQNKTQDASGFWLIIIVAGFAIALGYLVVMLLGWIWLLWLVLILAGVSICIWLLSLLVEYLFFQ